ncbi:MAG: MFS transporter, partial [Promethearchaeota archaeon]
MESNLPNLLSNKPTIIRHNSYLVMFGAFFAVFICCMAGQINDIIMAVYIPFRFHGDSALFGYTFSAFAAGKLLMMFPMASISEKIGRKLSLTIVYIFYTIGTVLAAVAQNPVQFLIFRFIKGMNAFEAVNLALINDYFLEGKRGPPIAIYSASIGTGILAGNGFGGLFIKWFGMINSFYVLGGFTLLSIFFVLVFVKDNPDQNIHRKNS